MRKRDTVPEHPLRAAERKNAALKDEVRFLHEALFFTEVLAAGFFRGIPGRSGFGRVAVVDCRDCRYRNRCLEYSRMYPCKDFERRNHEKKNRKESRKKKKG